ncbi:hypothetical protein BN946_scf184943.g55 [Trametes cinnabarina]|uniref:Uncharacterized protein n=1 Tax=Pycnoporus cinnabarinus TaxID=5643 RepID=A0A060SCD0_PYCCI|nr:hypothetical protein BN946_scf184943.g55 [Trametes cinnabarina]
MDWGGHDPGHQGHVRLVLSWLDTMENLGVARTTIEGFKDRLAEMLGDLLRADTDEPEFCDPHLLAADRRNRKRTMAAITKEMRRKELLKTSEAALCCFSGTVATSTEAPAAPSSQMPANIGYKSKPAAKVMVPGKPQFPLAISSPPSMWSATSVSKHKAQSPSLVREDDVIDVDEEEAVQEAAPPSKKRSQVNLPVLSSPTYSRTLSRSRATAPFHCDRCSSTKSTDIVCVLRQGLPKCDRCFLQFTGCWAQKILGAKTKSYAEWFDSQGFMRADAPDAAELRAVMAARGRTSDIPAWAREGAANSMPRTPSQRHATVPVSTSGLQPSVPHPKHHAEVVIVEPSKSTSSARARSVESEDETDDIMMDDHSVHARFAMPPPASRAPSPPSPMLRERAPTFDAQNPLSSPHLDLSSIRLTAIKATPVFRNRIAAINQQLNGLFTQCMVIDDQIAHLRSLCAQAVEEDARVAPSSLHDRNVESEEDLEDGSADAGQ